MGGGVQALEKVKYFRLNKAMYAVVYPVLYAVVYPVLYAVVYPVLYAVVYPVLYAVVYPVRAGYSHRLTQVGAFFKLESRVQVERSVRNLR